MQSHHLKPSFICAAMLLAVGSIAALPPHQVESRKNATKPWTAYEAVSLDRIPGFTPKADPALDEYGGWLGTNVGNPEGFFRVGRAIGWCKARNLKVVLDLHKTAGFSFDVGEAESGFFSSEKFQNRFYRLWEELARRFYDPENVAFELLNEVTDESFIDAWNRISRTCIERIRPIAPKALILIGSYHNNSVDAVKDLAAPADDRVIYNFHCYSPLEFTHQGAPWVPDMAHSFRQSFEEAAIPEDYFEKAFASAVETAEKNNTALYCGEYGVIDRANPEDTVKWFRLIHAAFEKYQISRAAWSYKEMDFGLSDSRMDAVRDELIPLL